MSKRFWINKHQNYKSSAMKVAVGLSVYNLVLLLLTTCGGAETYAATISLSVSDSITAAVWPESSSDTFTSDTNTTNISVTTDNVTGYTLSLKGNSSSVPALTSTNGSIPSISTSIDTLDKFTAGTWGYKPTKKNGNSWNDLAVKHGNSTYALGHYLPGPTTTEDILDVTDAANDTANQYNLAVATKLSSGIKPGKYSNTFIVAAVTNEVPTYTVTYTGVWGDIEDYAEERISTHDGKTTKGAFTYSAGTIISLENYFYHLSSSFTSYGTFYLNGVEVTSSPGRYNWIVNSNAVIHSTDYAGEVYINTSQTPIYDITLNDQSATSAGTTDIYEYYTSGFYLASGRMTTTTNPITKPTKSGYNFDGYYTGQNGTGTKYIDENGYLTSSADPSHFTTAGMLYANWKINPCGDTPTMQNLDKTLFGTTGAQVQLCDERDGTKYYASKLKDGKIWMLDNLALDLTNSTVKTNLTSSTTNASDTTLNYLKNGGGTTSDKYATAGVANWTSSYSYSAPLINTASKDKVYGAPADGKGNNKVGVYYNYCAASAGSYCYGNGTSKGTSSGNASEDICPKGWRMPTGGSSGEYQALYTAYSSNNTNFRNALSLPLSGYFYNGSARSQGSYGYFWSSTRYDDFSMYDLYANTSDIYPAILNSRNESYSVRCVAGS